MRANDSRLQIVRADITELKVDAIVNAANAELAGGGGVDGAIHRAAGPRLIEACRQIGGCETGSAVVTPGFDLPAQFVVHAVGPIWNGGGFGEAELLAGCYRKCMQLARGHEWKTIAFAAISCGVYGFPLAQAAQIAVDTIASELSRCPTLARVDLVCFGDEVTAAYRQAMA